MRVLVNRHTVDSPWGGGNNFVRALRKHVGSRGHQIVDRLSDRPDVILLAGLDADSMSIDAASAIRHRAANAGCKLILRVNDCDARKGTSGVDANIARVSKECDGVVFVSRWLRDHLAPVGSSTKMCDAIHNGVESDVFRRDVQIAPPKGRLKIVTHHWSDNPMKGRDVYECVDSMPEHDFTYVGRHRCAFKNPNTVVIPPLAGRDLARAISTHDVYITGTRKDPGPNHVLEAISCGLPTWSIADGGGAVEFVGEDHTFKDVDHLRQMLKSHCDELLVPNAYVPMSWEQSIEQYTLFMERVART